MNDKRIGTTLKALREDHGISAKEVVDILGQRGISISDKTLYGYEKGIRMPNADMLIELCKIYKCNNIMEAFSDIKDDVITYEELQLIDKYRFISKLSPDGAKTVDYILNREYDVAEHLKEWQDKNSDTSKMEEGQVIYLPELYSRFSAGTGQYSSDSGYEMTKVPRTALTAQATSIATISGDSMEPEYRNGDRVLVKTMPDIELGEIGVWAVNNELYIKAKGDGELISLNPDYDNIAIKENDSAYCIGRVLGKLD